MKFSVNDDLPTQFNSLVLLSYMQDIRNVWRIEKNRK